MAGIGEASAVVGVIQVGFSLATALNTYISDVSDASDDISSLVSDIEATLGQLRDLTKLIEKNQTVRAWSEDGLRNANKCVTDCEKIITKLRKLLQKSTASAASDQVTRDDIDVSKLERARWPFIKPQMEVRRRELQSIKQDIMIAYSSYMTQVGPEAERQKYSDDLPRLQRTRALAQRQVREAKEQRRRKTLKHPRDPHKRRFVHLPPMVPPPDPNWRYDRNGVPYPVYVPPLNPSEDEGGSIRNDDDGPLVYDNIEHLEREFEAWKLEDEKRKAELEAEKKAIQEDAVKAWKERQLLELDAKRQNIENARDLLRAELTKQRMAPQQIDDIVSHIHPYEKLDSDVQLLITATNDNFSSLTPSSDPMRVSSSRRWSVWSRKKSVSGQHSSTAATLVNEPHTTSVPDILSDPAAEGGVARLEAIYFQREVAEPPIIQKFCVEIPDKWLLDSLIKRQEAIARDPKKINSVWKDFSKLPAGYRHAIGEHIASKQDSGKSNENITWVLFHLDCMTQERRRNLFDRSSRADIVGVYVVLKQNKKPGDRSPEREDYNRRREIDLDKIFIQHQAGDDDDDDEVRSSYGGLRRSGTYDSSIRGRPPRERGYEPRHSQSSVRRDTTGSHSRRSTRESRNHTALSSSEQYYPPVAVPTKSVSFVPTPLPQSSPSPPYSYMYPHPHFGVPTTGHESEMSLPNLYQPPFYAPHLWQPLPSVYPLSLQHTQFAQYPGYPPPPHMASNIQSNQAVLHTLYPESRSRHSSSYAHGPYNSHDSHGSSFDPNHRPLSPEFPTSRSRSPRPLRRSGTDESRRSSDLQPNPTKVNFDPRLDERGSPHYLSTILEVETESDSSTSTDDSNDEEIDVSGRFVPGRPRRESDGELLDKTLREYVNPVPPAQNEIRAEVPATPSSSVHTNGVEEKTATAISEAEES